MVECEADPVIEYQESYAIVGRVMRPNTDDDLVADDGSPILVDFRPILYAYGNCDYRVGERIGTLQEEWRTGSGK